ncbi:hypothetical protein RchiOBHm_Chr7g0186991 [Rosa chinensis]|uniref:Uncharacterized protein n=1 Tax=Rosa chinensis TaxID=74649 RepID=A0A2P6P433_ROSCH|nr:hypothetical protein RchiOBHm_Chr7g0186991 [Rosa chinensis]
MVNLLSICYGWFGASGGRFGRFPACSGCSATGYGLLVWRASWCEG